MASLPSALRTRRFKTVAAALAFYGLAAVTVDNEYVDDFMVGSKCGGAVRWDIKTMADEDSRGISASQARFVTIEDIAGIDEEMPAGGRNERQDFEKKVYTVRCHITHATKEEDEDIHLILEHDGWEMVGEIVFPYCENIKHTGRKRTFEKVFRDFAPWRKRGAYKRCEWLVTGVAFMDHDHDQNGALPNGIELHPILSIQPLLPEEP